MSFEVDDASLCFVKINNAASFPDIAAVLDDI